jgi:hypothetical protein
MSFLEARAARPHASAEALVNRVDHLEQETGTILDGAAVLISAVIGQTGEKLLDQVAVCSMDLNTVEASLIRTDRCLLELLGSLLEVIDAGRLRTRRGIVPSASVPQTPWPVMAEGASWARSSCRW